MAEQPLEPRLRAAVLCEQVLEERDNVLSAIRIVDRMIVRATGKKVPDELPATQGHIKALMSWVGGLGQYEARIRVVLPNDQVIESSTMPFFLDSLERVQNFVTSIAFPIPKQGLYLFEFLLGDEVKNRIPLRVIYSREQLPPS